jgi:L-lactate dehydrogenase complex protein LldE
VTCLVDLFRPDVGFAAVRLLEDAGCAVMVPPEQTCCGQPAYNSGERASAAAIAKQVIAAFEGFDYTVAPSGSCAAMLRCHYPGLLEAEPAWGERAQKLAQKTFELTSFLTDVLGIKQVAARHDGAVVIHESCSALREMGVRDQPRALLDSVAGLTEKPLEHADVCCGFGGMFSVKYSEISSEMARKKTADITASGAQTVVGVDLGCLMNIAGRLSREGSPVAVRHVAEILADMTEAPPIGQPEKS